MRIARIGGGTQSGLAREAVAWCVSTFVTGGVMNLITRFICGGVRWKFLPVICGDTARSFRESVANRFIMNF